MAARPDGDAFSLDLRDLRFHRSGALICRCRIPIFLRAGPVWLSRSVLTPLTGQLRIQLLINRVRFAGEIWLRCSRAGPFPGTARMAILHRVSRWSGHRLRLRVLAVFGICPPTAIRNCLEPASPITKCNPTLNLVRS